MRKLTAALAATLLALSLVGCQPANRQLQEDDPGWNCHIHGNRICGPAPFLLVSDESDFTECDYDTSDTSTDC